MASFDMRKPRRGTGEKGRARRRGSEASPGGADWRARAEQTAAAPIVAPLSAAQTLTVTSDEAGMRLDRFLSARFPELPFSLQQRIIRRGEVRVDGGRRKPESRLEPGQQVRVPPIRHDRPPSGPRKDANPKVVAEVKAMTLYEDEDVLVLNKPYGLAVQGGSGTVHHLDGMLWALADWKGDRPRLVHRLDKDTAGCLLVAKSRFAASALAKSFRSRETRKIYWALVAGVPKVRQGRVSTYLAKDEEAEREGEARMRVAEHGEEGASHALTYYAVVDHAGRIASWVSLKPVTGRTHQLRAHMNHIGHPIVGDPKYFDRASWELPAGIQNRLHLLARRIVVPHPRTGKPIDVTAPLPQHMQQSWSLLGFEAAAYDPVVEAPDD
jgi:23S rRNA pseudouridine955/2504/2580 synthase